MSLQAQILGLSFAYALLGMVLLVGLTRARLAWPIKAAAIIATSACYILAFFGTQGLLGWSALDPLPGHFQLLWARTIEPDQAGNVPGAIHLWLEDLDDANLPSGVPRAYQLPYSAGLARKVESARVEIMAGHPQGGRAADFGDGSGEAPPNGAATMPRPGGGAEPGGDPSGGGTLDPDFLGGDSKSIEFAPLPVPVLPSKDAP